MSLLTRTLSLKVPRMTGDDVYGVRRSVCRALDSNDHGQRLKELETKSASVKRTFGPYFALDVNRCRKQMGMAQTGRVDQVMWAALMKAEFPDSRAIYLMESYIDQHPASTIVFPVPLGQMASICQGLHQTAGLEENWAIDFCSPANTTIVAVEAGTIAKLSGKAPSQDTADLSGTYGWSVHYRTHSGYRYYLTHLGWRLPSLAVGMSLQPGDTLGRVGDQWYRPDHQHLGVTSPLGEADAKRRITAVSKAPRVH